MQKNKRLFVILLVASLLLITPLVTMVFTNDANWSAFDFVVAGALFFSFGIILEIILRKKITNHFVPYSCFTLFPYWAELSVEFLVSLFTGNQPLISHKLP
ncbi:hypothetical protein [Mariniflexile sp. HMF6888]|uniref:hypothetical protein n=1 Tax=Mariniflexile sp. HMF6888 TaxID=3373086 RepID=UPI00379358D7